jgi:hypothetical protein
MEAYTSTYSAEIADEMLSPQQTRRLRFLHFADPRLRSLRRSSFQHGFNNELRKGWRPGTNSCPWLDKAAYVNGEGHVTACCRIKDTARFSLGRIGMNPPAQIEKRRQELRDRLRAGQVPDSCQGCRFAEFATMSPQQMVRYAIASIWNGINSPRA